MSAPGLTARELQLLAAVSKVLDIPYPATWQDRERYETVLRERIYRLLGVLDDPGEYITFAGILRGLESIAARPLGYAPDESAQ